jgi:DMSO/TMAO reductase YedYZ molybdopterin-dependent catalytic subunit
MFGKVETDKMKTSVMPDSSPESREHAAQVEQSVRGRGSPMEYQGVSRRTLLKGGGAALAGLTGLRAAGPAQAFPGHSVEKAESRWDDDQPDLGPTLGHPGDEVIPWLDQPPPAPFPPDAAGQLKWEELESWLTPPDKFHFVTHFGIPEGLDEATWSVDVVGLVARPLSLPLANLKARERREVDFTLECSGNHGTTLDFATGFIGNARWAGTPLAQVLEEAGLLKEATEVVFYGADSGPLTIRDNSGIVSGGQTGTEEPDAGGGIDLTITEQFARSMSLDDALNPRNLLCYEMNGEPLPFKNGFPVRLIAPGWYGVANVKWLTRIEVIDHRYAGNFMARDYVSIREEQRNGKTLWTFTTVRHDRLKSAPAKVTRHGGQYEIWGAAWGAPIAAVEVRIDEGPWMPAKLLGRSPRRRKSTGFAWRFWEIAWGTPVSGEHKITSRAFDVDGNMQPAPDDPFLASRRTFWESNGHITRRVLIP